MGGVSGHRFRRERTKIAFNANMDVIRIGTHCGGDDACLLCDIEIIAFTVDRRADGMMENDAGIGQADHLECKWAALVYA
jgi:hypothetical protein